MQGRVLAGFCFTADYLRAQAMSIRADVPPHTSRGGIPMPRPPAKHEQSTSGSCVNFDAVVSQFFERQPSVSVRADIAAESHAGKARPNNEDHYLVVKRYRGREVLLTSLPVESLSNNEDHAYTLAVAD